MALCPNLNSDLPFRPDYNLQHISSTLRRSQAEQAGDLQRGLHYGFILPSIFVHSLRWRLSLSVQNRLVHDRSHCSKHCCEFCYHGTDLIQATLTCLHQISYQVLILETKKKIGQKGKQWIIDWERKLRREDSWWNIIKSN